MKICEQYHEILECPKNPLQLIELSGRNCYQSQDKIGCTLSKCEAEVDGELIEFQECNTCKHHSSYKFIKMLKDKGHHAMLEFGNLTIRLVTNRGVLAELTRHRMASYAVSSTRYVRLDNNMEFIRPVWCCHELSGDWKSDYPKNLSGPEYTFFNNCVLAEIAYKKLLEQKWKPEQAREVLPNSLKTEIIMSCNFREMIHILKLRTSKRAHPQIRALMLPLLAELKDRIPVIFDDIKAD
jgi:thymidylate synthase (FAD)